MNYTYLAGYIDGDGYISIRKYLQKSKVTVYTASIEICSVYEPICKYFIENFKGTYYLRPEKRENRKKSWLWRITGKNVLAILYKTLDFMILKKNHTRICIDMLENISKSKCYIGNPVSEDTIKFREDLLKKIKQEIHMNNIVNEDLFNSLKEVKKIKTPSNADLSYMAGLIDSEGCFRIQHWNPKRKGRTESWVVTLEIGNSKFPIFPWILERFGGCVRYRKSTKPTHNSMIIWSLRSDSLFQFLPLILPYLIVKKERCEKIKEFHQTGFSVGGDRHSSEFKERMMQVNSARKILYDEFKILNQKGNH